MCFGNMDWKDCLESFCEGVLRFLCALLWLAVLCSFSFYDLINFVIHDSDHTISMEIVKEMQSLKMILANVGLIGMVYVDNMFLSMLTKKGNESWCQKFVLLCSIIVAIYLSLVSQGVDINDSGFRWENMPVVLFVIYLLTLLIYKMQSFEIVHSKGKSFKLNSDE